MNLNLQQYLLWVVNQFGTNSSGFFKRNVTESCESTTKFYKMDYFPSQ